MNNWYAKFDACIVEHITTWEVVCAIHNHVVSSDDVHDVACVQACVIRDYIDIWIEHRQCLFCRVHLAITNAINVVQDLTLQVAGVHFVHVDNADCSHAGSGQIQRCRTSKSTRTQQQHFAGKQFCLSFNTYFWQQNMSLITIALLGS